MKNKIILSTVFATFLLPATAMAGCTGFWDCTLNIAGKTTKLAAKTVVRTAGIAGAGIAGAAKSYANGDGVGEIVLGGLGGAAEETVYSIADTVVDVIEVGGAVADGVKKAAED